MDNICMMIILKWCPLSNHKNLMSGLQYGLSPLFYLPLETVPQTAVAQICEMNGGIVMTKVASFVCQTTGFLSKARRLLWIYVAALTRARTLAHLAQYCFLWLTACPKHQAKIPSTAGFDHAVPLSSRTIFCPKKKVANLAAKDVGRCVA